MIKCHLQHIEDDARHNCYIKCVTIDNFPHSEPWISLRLVAQLVRWFCFDNQPLQLKPIQLVFTVASVFLLLGLLILEK